MSPTPNANGHVPWSVYVEDRRASTARLERIEDNVQDVRTEVARGFEAIGEKLDTLGARQQAIELAAAREDGEDVATDAASQALKQQKKSKAERWWDIGRTVFASALTLAVALLVYTLTGGSS